jgi:c-di-GMP-binding flagellar brake protein YcgR
MSEQSAYGSERRQSFRIEDEVHLDYRPLQEGEQPEDGDKSDITGVCRGLMQLRELNIQAGHALATIRKQHSELAHYLSILDRKIETLAQMTGAIGMGRDIRPSTPVNIGSGGMAFAARETLPKGSRLALKLVLFPSHLCLQLTARVAYSQADNGKGECWTGVEFEPLPEHENDALIRHLLEKQSAQLRKERESE